MTTENAELIWKVYQQDGNGFSLRLSHQLGYKKSVFYSVIKQRGIIKEGWKHLNKKKKLSPEQITLIINLIEANPQMTLLELSRELAFYRVPSVSLSTLSRYLNCELITMKWASFQHENRNTEESKIKRYHYSEWFLTHQEYEFIFVDEFGFNFSTQRNYARSKEGQPAIVISPINAAVNTSVAMAISRNNGIIYFEDKKDAYNSDDFMIYFTNLCQAIHHMEINNPCIILDNCPIHKKEDINSVSSFFGYD